MHHSHFKTIDSTQIYLRDHLFELKKHSPNILISTDEQTSGIGRRGNSWDFYANSIAMSFTLTPHLTPTLTPIEIGILTAHFLEKEFSINIKLKWPNDLLTPEGKKCGGIIAQYIDNETVIAGLGLNLGAIENKNIPAHYKHGLGVINSNLALLPDDQKIISYELYNFLLKNRLSDQSSIQDQFNKYCLHLNKQVLIEDDGENYQGKFVGIGLNGEAIIETSDTRRSFLGGSLTILD